MPAWDRCTTRDALAPSSREEPPRSALPVLRWGDRLVAETLVIPSFLHRALGDEAEIGEERSLRHAIIMSSLYCDAMLPVGILLWSEVMYTGADFADTAKRTLEHLKAEFEALERTIVDWGWLDRRRRPLLADCLLWEELSVAERVFGEHWSLASLPTLERFYREFEGRETCERVLAERPCAITARPAEDEAIERIRAILGR